MGNNVGPNAVTDFITLIDDALDRLQQTNELLKAVACDGRVGLSEHAASK